MPRRSSPSTAVQAQPTTTCSRSRISPVGGRSSITTRSGAAAAPTFRIAAPSSGSPPLFVRELQNLVEALGISERHHVLGQSWGGFLAQEYAFTQPAGLRSLVLADTAASWADFATEANTLRELLPPEVQATLTKHEEAGSYDDLEYMEACLVFYSRHVCRIPWPPEVAKSFEYLEQDPTVYRTMNGPSEFHIIGSCKDWQVKDRLHEIHLPALLVSGRHDEATPALQQVLLDGIAGSEWVVFEGVVSHAARRGT